MYATHPVKSLWKKLRAKLASQALPRNTYTALGQDFAFLHRAFRHTGVMANGPDSAMTFMDQTSLSFQTHRTYIQRNNTVKWGQSLTLTMVSTWGRTAYKSDHHLGFTQHRPRRTCSFPLSLSPRMSASFASKIVEDRAVLFTPPSFPPEVLAYSAPSTALR